MIDIDAAVTFLHLNARLLERHRYACLFEDAGAEPVLAALRAYRNPDGGFGHAIEPDLRGPASQPAGVQSAMEILHEAGAHDAELIEGGAGFLASIERPGGGVPFVLETALEHPRGPWWQPADATSLTQTAANAAALHALNVDHPWLDRASEYVWQRVEALDFLDNAYDTRFTIGFLDHVPDGSRAEGALDALRPRVQEAIGEDPDAPGEHHAALEFSPLPGARSRRLFDHEQIERDLDALEAGQKEDGGWTFDFPAWCPAATLDWRGLMTVDALKVLRANGRF
jgi:hypothetical protein